MPSILHLGGEKYVTIDRMWRDNGADAQYGLVGGQKILIDKGSRPKPTICQRGTEFFYQDGTKVTRKDDVDWLPEPFRTSAIKFVEKNEATKPSKVETYETKEEAVEAAAPPKKRGRPKNESAKPKVIEIKDEESYLKAGGVIV